MYQVQSYYSTIMRHDFTVYEMRIMLKIVQRTRLITYGKKYADYLRKPFDSSGLNLDFAIPLKEFLGKSHNYEPLKQALRSMQEKWKVEYYDKEKRCWHLSSMINNVVIEERLGILRFSSPRWLVEYICDFSNGGYREYDFEMAMSMRNAFAARFYLITCSMNKPLLFNYDELKRVLGVEDKYKRFPDFERRVLKPAMRELEKRGCNGFSYDVIREVKDKPSSRVYALRIKPVKREKNAVREVEVRKGWNEKVPPILTAYLAQNFNFSFSELKGNMNTLAEFCKRKDWQEKFFEITERTRRKNKNHGYLISALKSEIEK